ncbi:FGGY-family carbohydrate kinase [Ensifer soli]|uniref:FGGY-family carbohydrate kinase n=1 Tax=Ciceribacter sp. sgz301302 TaxID=3342379 RepID=UPI0035B9D8DC
MKTVAVIDIGKTNAKVALVDLDRFEEVAVRRTGNAVVREAPYPHFDTARLWAFILDSLAELHRETPVDAISVTAHGATAVLVDAHGDLALPVLDYEHSGPDTVRPAYDRVRPPFSETGSAELPGGLNIGAQIYWQQQTFPDAFSRVASILTYAQYWTFLLTGVRTTELTSLGCHSDLWNPKAGRFSTLVDAQGWERLFAPVHQADDGLGGLTEAVAARTGLPKDTPVTCGIHDSNASLLPHLLARPAPFSVVSTGTWVVILSVGGADVVLDEHRDTLINVNALGDPVPSARFMGGRAFATLIGNDPVSATEADIEQVLARSAMLLPSVPQGSGPYPSMVARFTVDEAALSPGERFAVVSFHLALMTATSLGLIGAAGDIIVEGPFAANATYLRMLSAATGRAVRAGSQSATGTSLGAACLAARGRARVRDGAPVRETSAAFAAYARDWLGRVEAEAPQGSSV